MTMGEIVMEKHTFSSVQKIMVEPDFSDSCYGIYRRCFSQYR